MFKLNITLQVRFARPESEQARQRRIQSYEFLQKKQAEEPWVHLHYHGVKVGGALVITLPLFFILKGTFKTKDLEIN